MSATEPARGAPACCLPLFWTRQRHVHRGGGAGRNGRGNLEHGPARAQPAAPSEAPQDAQLVVGDRETMLAVAEYAPSGPAWDRAPTDASLPPGDTATPEPRSLSPAASCDAEARVLPSVFPPALLAEVDGVPRALHQQQPFRRASSGVPTRKPSLLSRPALGGSTSSVPTAGERAVSAVPLTFPASEHSSFTTARTVGEPDVAMMQRLLRRGSSSTSNGAEPRVLHNATSALNGGPDVLSSILSEGGLPSSIAQSGELSRFQSLHGCLSSAFNADTGHISTTAVEQLRQQLLAEQQQGLAGRPIAVDTLEKLGQGSYGVVYRAVWQGANVAVKYLVSSSTQQLQISATEALLSKLLAHPNVVQTFACKVVELTDDYFAAADGGGAGGGGDTGQYGRWVHGSAVVMEPHALCTACHAPSCPGCDGAGRALPSNGTAPRRALPAVSGGGGGRGVHTHMPTAPTHGDAAAAHHHGASAKETHLAQLHSPEVLVPRGVADMVLDIEQDARAMGDQLLPPRPAAPLGPSDWQLHHGSGRSNAHGSGGAEEAAAHETSAGAGAAAAAVAAAGANGWAAPTSADAGWTVRASLEERHRQPHVGGLLPEGGDEERLGVEHALESFRSGDGFGAPYLGAGEDGASHVLPKYLSLLRQLRAKPQDCLTQIIMECCDRGSLQRAIDKQIFRPSARWNARVALRAMLRTAREVAQGMCHLHASQIVHGDLKPANVLLKSSRSDRRGFIAKVADFGLSKIVQVASQRTSLECDTDTTGTLAYMAPEVLNGSLCPAADVYSFGVMLWQLATGERPFADVHPGRMWVGVCSGALRLEWPADVHPMVRKLGDACLSPDKRQRPSFTKVARVLGVIETVVRNEGAAAAAAAASASIGSGRGPNGSSGHTGRAIGSAVAAVAAAAAAEFGEPIAAAGAGHKAPGQRGGPCMPPPHFTGAAARRASTQGLASDVAMGYPSAIVSAGESVHGGSALGPALGSSVSVAPSRLPLSPSCCSLQGVASESGSSMLEPTPRHPAGLASSQPSLVFLGGHAVHRCSSGFGDSTGTGIGPLAYGVLGHTGTGTVLPVSPALEQRACIPQHAPHHPQHPHASHYQAYLQQRQTSGLSIGAAKDPQHGMLGGAASNSLDTGPADPVQGSGTGMLVDPLSLLPDGTERPARAGSPACPLLLPAPPSELPYPLQQAAQQAALSPFFSSAAHASGGGAHGTASTSTRNTPSATARASSSSIRPPQQPLPFPFGAEIPSSTTSDAPAARALVQSAPPVTAGAAGARALGGGTVVAWAQHPLTGTAHALTPRLPASHAAAPGLGDAADGASGAGAADPASARSASAKTWPRDALVVEGYARLPDSTSAAQQQGGVPVRGLGTHGRVAGTHEQGGTAHSGVPPGSPLSYTRGSQERDAWIPSLQRDAAWVPAIIEVDEDGEAS